MEKQEKIFALIGVAAALSIIVLLYSALSANFIAEKIGARDAAFAGLGANGNVNQQAPEPAEITLTLITDSNNQNLIPLDSLVLQLEQLAGIKIIAEKKRTEAGMSAPAHGLFLAEVQYPPRTYGQRLGKIRE